MRQHPDLGGREEGRRERGGEEGERWGRGREEGRRERGGEKGGGEEERGGENGGGEEGRRKEKRRKGREAFVS